MESKRTILNNILRIVSAEEARNQALTEEVKLLRKAVFAVRADSMTTITTLTAFANTQKTLVAMMRELINEVKKLHTPKVVSAKVERVPLTNDVIKIKPKEKDLFSQTKQHYDYTGAEKTIGQAKAVKTLLAEGYNLSDRPFLALHSLVRNLGIPVLPTKAKNAKSGNYRLYVKDLQKIRDYLG